MDIGLLRPAVNRLVPGGPPSMDSWCVVGSSPVGVLVKPAGTIAFHVNGTDAWLNFDGTAAGWQYVPDLAYLAPIIAAYVAGWRPGVVVHDAAFNGASVTVYGLSAAKRYRIAWTIDGGGAGPSYATIKPSGSIAGCFGYVLLENGNASYQTSWAHIWYKTEVKRVLEAVVNPRHDGTSLIHSGTTVCGAGTQSAATVVFVGTVTTDFTSLLFEPMGGLPATGHLKLVEETP